MSERDSPARQTSLPKYWAFISYSHADRKRAHWLQRQLESYRVPIALCGRKGAHGMIPQNLAPVFLDRTDLTAAPDLGHVVRTALQQARFLIVVCSPQSARSQWVHEEVKFFKQLGRADKVLCLVVDGIPGASDGKPGSSVSDECFVKALRFQVTGTGDLGPRCPEPLASDLREKGDGPRNAVIKLIAAMLGVEYDALRRRDEEIRRRRHRRITAFVFSLAILFAALSAAALWQWRTAEQQRKLAVERTARLRRILSGLVWNLHDHVDSLPGAIKFKDDFLGGAKEYLSQLDAEDGNDIGLKRELSVGYSKLGRVKFEQGKLSESRENAERSLSIARQLANGDPQNAVYRLDVAQDLTNIGDACALQGKPDDAKARYAEASSLLERDRSILPTYEPVKRQLADLYRSSAVLAYEGGDVAGALSTLEQAQQLGESLVDANPMNATYIAELAQTLSCMSAAHRDRQDADAAERCAIQSIQTCERVTKFNRQHRPCRLEWARAKLELALLHVAAGRDQAALADASESIDALKALREMDPEDATVQSLLARALIAMGRIHSVAGRIDDARRSLIEGGAIGAHLVKVDPANAAARAIGATADAQLALALHRAGRADQARLSARQALEMLASMRADGIALSSDLKNLQQQVEAAGVR